MSRRPSEPERKSICNWETCLLLLECQSPSWFQFDVSLQDWIWFESSSKPFESDKRGAVSTQKEFLFHLIVCRFPLELPNCSRHVDIAKDNRPESTSSHKRRFLFPFGGLWYSFLPLKPCILPEALLLEPRDDLFLDLLVEVP